MCEFFSFITYKGRKLFFNYEQRKIEKNPDSHSRIAEAFLGSSIREDRSNKYEFTCGGLRADSITDEDECQDDVKDWAEEFVQSREFWAINVLSLVRHGKGEWKLIPESLQKPTEVMLHEFACWSAEQCLGNYEKEYPNDFRVRIAIETKRRWLRGEATDDELSAAESAAWSAAESAGRGAARSAASAERSAAWSAAWSAARRAASSAASSAARSAAWGAASGAARNAAWSAARSAAWSAASSAESSAASSAARSAQLSQLELLMEQAWPSK